MKTIPEILNYLGTKSDFFLLNYINFSSLSW